MRGGYFWFGIVIFLLGIFGFRQVYALSVDVDDNQVGVYLNFSGSDTTLFGSVKDGENIVVVVTGPRETVRLYKKVQSFGVWTNRRVAELSEVPGYYYSSMNNRFLLGNDVPNGQALIANEVGMENLDIRGEGSATAKEHIIRVMQDRGLYTEDHSGVRLVDKNLFKVEIPIPKNAPTGVYTIRILTFGADNYYNRMRVLPMFVRKRGLIAFISHHARVNALLYGVGVVLTSLLVGSLIVVALRRLR